MAEEGFNESNLSRQMQHQAVQQRVEFTDVAVQGVVTKLGPTFDPFTWEGSSSALGNQMLAQNGGLLYGSNVGVQDLLTA